MMARDGSLVNRGSTVAKAQDRHGGAPSRVTMGPGQAMTIVRCFHCRKATAAEAALCAHCGRRVEEPKRRDADSPLTCPACSKVMDLAWLASIQVDVCPGCKGVWFDKGELVDLPKRLTGKELADAAAEMLGSYGKHAGVLHRGSYLRCPVCAGHLARQTYGEVSGILTDHCQRCGTWADRPSMLRILRLISDGRVPEVEERAERKETLRPRVEPVVDREDWLAAMMPPLRPRGTTGFDGSEAVELVWVLLRILAWFI
jgi:Zn-finger nucleic acid-binding protein